MRIRGMPSCPLYILYISTNIVLKDEVLGLWDDKLDVCKLV